MPHTLTLIDALRKRPVASRSELQADTGLSPASMSRAIQKLRRAGLVEERAAAVSGVGRPPSVVEFRPEAAHVVGIDAGGTSLRVEIADLAGRLVARSSLTLRGRRDASAIVKAIAEAVLASATQADAKPIAAAAGEAAFGAAEGCTEVVFLSLGLGLGAGLLVGGRPVRGVRSAAGAIAYFAPGSLQDVASGKAIPRRYNERRGERPGTPRRTAKRIIEFASAGDADAKAVIDDAVDALGAAVVNVGTLLDPEVIVLGGGLARGIPSLVDALAARLRDALPFPPRVVLSGLGEDAVARGAGSLALTIGQRQLAGVTAEPGRLGALEFV